MDVSLWCFDGMDWDWISLSGMRYMVLIIVQCCIRLVLTDDTLKSPIFMNKLL